MSITKDFFVINLNITTIYNNVKYRGCLPFSKGVNEASLEKLWFA